MAIQRAEARSSAGSNLADILERVLDKGIVIAGDIKLSLGEVELLSLQIRLVICSVDKAREIGMDWWTNHPSFSPRAAQPNDLEGIEQRLERIEEVVVGKKRRAGKPKQVQP